MRKVFAALATVGLVATMLAASSSARVGTGEERGPKAGPHNLAGPLAVKQTELRKKALQLQMQGKLSKDAKVARVGKKNPHGYGQFVELSRTGEDTIWTVLVEFGDQ